MQRNKIIYLLLIGLGFLPYELFNQTVPNVHILKFGIDRWIPLLPIFVIPYLLFLPFLIGTLIYFICFSKFDAVITTAFILCLLIAYSFYMFYPTTVLRPEITANDFLSKVVAFIYSIDNPYNCFPSLHTALSVLALLFWAQAFPTILLPMGVFTLSILLSTLFTKQHYTPDVFSGILLAILCFSVNKFFHQARLSDAREAGG